MLIIGILAAIALPQYEMAIAKSRASTAVGALKVLGDAAQRYFLTTGTYTTSIFDLDISVESNNYYVFIINGDQFYKVLAKPKVKKLPVIEYNTKTNRKNCYSYSGDGGEIGRKLCEILIGCSISKINEWCSGQ